MELKTIHQQVKSVIPETIQVINTRRAVRKYKNKRVIRNIINQIISAGMMAPSAMNKQPWKFYVLDNRDIIKLFSKEISKVILKNVVKRGPRDILKAGGDLLHFRPNFNVSAIMDPVFYRAPVVIFITAPIDDEWAALDVGMCAQNIMLAAKSLGLDTCPIGFAKFVMNTKDYNKLQIPSSERVLLGIVIGYGDENPEVHERELNNKITFIN